MKRMHRRAFLQKAALGMAPLIVPRTALGRGAMAPGERITVGVIGLGSRGFNLLQSFLMERGAEVVALCDVDRLHYRDNPWGEGHAFGRDGAREAVAAYTGIPAEEGPKVYSDYREVCGRDDIDAIVVATPDHWHAHVTCEALRNRKDVYCEKPVTHLFAEGQAVYREVAKRGAVFQAGSQQRSDLRFRHAVELIRNGVIGRITRVEVGLPEGYDEPMGDPTVKEPPEDLDYDFWCGPSPALPYMRARHHRWWRGHRAYGGGVLMDWIGHHNDIAHWGLNLDESGPRRVEAVDWEMATADIYNTPHHYTIRCEYPGGITSVISNKNALGCKWIGDDGWVYVKRGTLEASEPAWVKRSFDPGPAMVYSSNNHTRNFLECVRSRETCIAPAETAHRAITPGHLGYVSHALGRAIQWDPAAEQVVDDDEANTLLKAMDYRAPWALDV